MKATLGLDTSCYVTSVALVDDTGGILLDGREPLHVDNGKLGLRQNEAFFLHMRQLQPLIEKAFAALNETGMGLRAIGASNAPRDCEDSYMPVFVAGHSTASVLAASRGVALHAFSHQQGHIRAAMIGIEPVYGDYLAIHLSGGTTEVLRVFKEGLKTQILGGTKDISAGQWIDRIGMLMGCPFPAGPALESLAKKGRIAMDPIGIPVKDCSFSFSGAEAEVKRRIIRGDSPSELALEMFLSLSRALCKAMVQAYDKTGLSDVVVAGGVAANRIVQKTVVDMMAKRCRDIQVRFARADTAGDNALGIALLAMEREGNACSAN